MKEPSKLRTKQNNKQTRTFYRRSKQFRLMKKLVRPEYFINTTTECVSVMFLIQLSLLILREEMRCFLIPNI